MNDTAEGKWIERHINNWCEKYKEIHEESIIATLKELYNKAKPNIHCFLCCFSGDGDTLSQWRAYANDGRGVCIGFSRASFDIPVSPMPTPHPLNMRDHGDFIPRVSLTPVIYDPLLQEKIVEVFLEYAIKNNQNLFFAIDQLTGFALNQKNNAFSEEKECRLVLTVPSHEIAKPLNIGRGLSGPFFRTTSNCLSPYFTKKLANPMIREIVFGPKNTSDEEYVKIFLRSHGFDNVTVRRSEATYR